MLNDNSPHIFVSSEPKATLPTRRAFFFLPLLLASANVLKVGLAPLTVPCWVACLTLFVLPKRRDLQSVCITVVSEDSLVVGGGDHWLVIDAMMTKSPSSLSGNGGGGNAKTKNNSVQFGPQLRVDIREVEMVEDLAAMWWTQAEIQEGRKEYEAVLFLMETGKEVNEEEHSARGLEKKTEDGAWALYENQRDAANAVLGEQDTLRRNRVKDDCVHQTIAEACLVATAQSREAALAIGAKDYAQIKDYLHGISHSTVPASPKVRVRRKMTHTISPPGSPMENKWGRRISMPLMLPIGSPENKKMAKAAALALARQQVSTKKLKVFHPSSSALTDEDDLSSSENDDLLLFTEKKKATRKASGEKKVKKSKKKSKAAASEDKPKKRKSASAGKTTSAAATVDKTTGETILAKATTATSAVGEAELQQMKDEIETLEKKIALKQAKKAKATALKMMKSPTDSPKKKTKKTTTKKDDASPSSPKKKKKKPGLTRSSSSSNMEKKLARLSKHPGASSFRKGSSILSTASTEPNDSEPNDDSEDDDVIGLSSYLKTTTTAHNKQPIATTPTTQRPRLFLSRVIGSFRRKGKNDTNGYYGEDLNGSLSVCDYDEEDDASLADHSVSAESCCF